MFKLLKITIFLLLCVIQISFIPALPSPFFNINIIIIGLVIFLALNNLEDALAWGTAAGILLDVYSFHFFGLYILSLTAMLVLTDLFLRKFFTNRSVYSFIFLNSLALVFFEAARLSLIFLFDFFTKGIFYQDIFSAGYFSSLAYKLIFGIVIIFISFYSINYYSKKMKSFFITVAKK